MALLCYNKGCGKRFDPEHNAKGKWACLSCTQLECVLLSRSAAMLPCHSLSCKQG